MTVRVLILGGGPAGYAAAVAAASLGADTTLVERVRVGGSCTLWDAIPSKTLLNAADGFTGIEHARYAGLHLDCEAPELRFGQMMRRVQEVVDHQCEGVAQRLATHGVRIVQGSARIIAAGEVEITAGTGTTSVQYDRLIVATGANPWLPDDVPADDPRVLTTRSMWTQLSEMPESLVVVGSGATGCEMADFFQRCGTQVTMVSSRERILPGEDRDVAWVVENAFLQRGMRIRHNARARGVAIHADRVDVELGEGERVSADRVLYAVGMQPATADLGLDVLGVELGDRGGIRIDDACRTSVDGVYAVGDVTGGVMLASVASMQGRHAAMHALGVDVEAIAYHAVASTVFTQPEIADVGLSAAAASEAGRTVATITQPLRNNPRGVIHGATDGLVKLVYDPTDGTILGGSVVGLRASELILTVALAVRCQLSVVDLAETGAVNPSMSESLQRAAERAAATLPGIAGHEISSGVALGN